MTDIMTAVSTAKQYVQQFYPDQDKFELEEIEMSDDDKFWLITIGMEDLFPLANPLSALVGNKINVKPRKYKIIQIDAKTGDVKSMKIREVA